ncbi:Uncharacterized protein F383_36267 [Gossypium arboreum]|uniref:Uncharacterized protein n=1 Tax=Gossypium arboreum TaxID=29729 RepID=A0A0B0PTQ3_GOSAR|nr:Uncharacterized protein F383_36267 [Gossypium arboreum]
MKCGCMTWYEIEPKGPRNHGIVSTWMEYLTSFIVSCLLDSYCCVLGTVVEVITPAGNLLVLSS